MQITKTGSAHWTGQIKDGKGTISTESGALMDQPYGFNTRFEGVKGSNPEELIGAAHAACFTMFLSKLLGDAGFTPAALDTSAHVTLEKEGAGFTISKIHLSLEGAVPGADSATFTRLANQAKSECPVSKLLSAEITMDASLKP
ncbi:MAG: OsmC family protein [Gammaproteobacteria bacterium]